MTVVYIGKRNMQFTKDVDLGAYAQCVYTDVGCKCRKTETAGKWIK